MTLSFNSIKLIVFQPQVPGKEFPLDQSLGQPEEDRSLGRLVRQCGGIGLVNRSWSFLVMDDSWYSGWFSRFVVLWIDTVITS